IANRFTAPPLPVSSTPSVLWRLAARPDGTGLIGVMQAASEAAIKPGTGSYGSGGCFGAVTQPAVVSWSLDRQPTGAQLLSPASLPVDVAMDPSGSGVAVPFAGESKVPGASQLALLPASSLPPDGDDAGPPP